MNYLVLYKNDIKLLLTRTPSTNFKELDHYFLSSVLFMIPIKNYLNLDLRAGLLFQIE